MNIKRDIKNLIGQLQEGTISAADRARLDEYIKNHPEYIDLVKTDQILKSQSSLFPVPEPEKFAFMRDNVIKQIRRREEKRSAGPESIFEQLYMIILRPEMAAAALTLIVGFFLGRLFPSDKESLNSEIIDQISVLATKHDNLADLKNSPYVYSNVSFKDHNNGKISLSFDVTTHLDILSKKDDPLVRDVMAQSLINPSNVGTDLKTISYSETMADRKLKEALIYSVHSAPSLAVRLKAMNGLQQYQNDAEVQNAFIKVLKDESSVKMRLMAVDYLTKTGIAPDSLRRIVSESNVPQSPAVLIKVKNYANEF
jgi:hypothetical protein